MARTPAIRWRLVAVITLAAAVAIEYLSLALDGRAGSDFALYQREVQAWLGGAPMYPASQLAGPYAIEPTSILYPPVTIALFAPTLLLPLWAWWLIPAVALGAAVWRLRPSQPAIAAMLVCLALPASPPIVVAGNPDIWLAAALAVALVWRPAAAAFLLLKPSVFPFALIGIRSRGWWLLSGLFAAASLVLLPQTLDWLRSVANAGNGARNGGLIYSLGDVPFLALPCIAWLGRRQEVTETRRAARVLLELRERCVLPGPAHADVEPAVGGVEDHHSVGGRGEGVAV